MNSSKINIYDCDDSIPSKEYVEQIAQTVGNALKVYTYPVTATVDGQTEFTIPHSTFDATRDSIMLQSGRTILLQGEDYTVSGTTITLVESIPIGRMLGIYVMTIVGGSEIEQNTDGSVIAVGTIPLDRLSPDAIGELQSGAVVSEHTEFMEDGSIVTTYGDGTSEITVFGEDTITKTKYKNSVAVGVETTTFNADGSIDMIPEVV